MIVFVLANIYFKAMSDAALKFPEQDLIYIICILMVYGIATAVALDNSLLMVSWYLISVVEDYIQLHWRSMKEYLHAAAR